MRVCGDYKITANRAILIDSYPLPRVDDIFSNLAGGKYFSKLDMSNVYLQLPLDETSQHLVAINTHKWLFKYNHLPFGVSSAPAIFQRSMEILLQGQEGVLVYLDDILVTGTSVTHHLENLAVVLTKLEDAGLRLNRKKCSFMHKRIEYLGHILDSEGLRPTEEKVRAVRDAPVPTNVTQLRSFLGILNYYHKFLPNLSSKLNPLYMLLSQNTPWKWGVAQDEAFNLAKDALQADSLLVHFDESKPLILSCDASQYGIGAVLSHRMPNGEERPIAYASRTLNSHEKGYSQI